MKKKKNSKKRKKKKHNNIKNVYNGRGGGNKDHL